MQWRLRSLLRFAEHTTNIEDLAILAILFIDLALGNTDGPLLAFSVHARSRLQVTRQLAEDVPTFVKKAESTPKTTTCTILRRKKEGFVRIVHRKIRN